MTAPDGMVEWIKVGMVRYPLKSNGRIDWDYLAPEGWYPCPICKTEDPEQPTDFAPYCSRPHPPIKPTDFACRCQFVPDIRDHNKMAGREHTETKVHHDRTTHSLETCWSDL